MSAVTASSESFYSNAWGEREVRHLLNSLRRPDVAMADPLGRLLCEALDDAEEHHLLRPGARPGLDLLAWTLVHGFASLAVDGLLPVEASGQLLETLRRLMLRDAVLRRLGASQP